MRRESTAPTNSLSPQQTSTRKWRPVLMDQLMRCDGHPGDDATGLLEWLALWQAPKGGLL